MIDGIIEAVSIPVMAKARIGHFVEAQVLQELGVDYIDESEVLSPADYVNHIDKWSFTVPFVCGATNLGEALRRINEGAAMIRSKGEAGTGDVSEATKHIRKITSEINVAPLDDEGRALRRRQGAAGAVRARRRDRRDRQAARRALRRRRRRDAGRRRDDDAARRRRRLRRLGHLQVGQPGRARRGDREGDDVLRRRRRSSPTCRAASARPWSASTSPTSPRRTASPSAAGNADAPRVDPRVGVLALQGDVREHARVLTRRSAPTSRSCAAPPSSRRSTAS